MRIMRRPDQGKGDRLLYLRRITNKTYCIAHETVLSVMCQPGWERFWGRTDTCKCMVESPRCSPETTTILLIVMVSTHSPGTTKAKGDGKKPGDEGAGDEI